MKIVIAANAKKAKILCSEIKNTDFLYLKEFPQKRHYEKVVVFPCFIYKGHEYSAAVKKIISVYPNADVLPPLISIEKDYFLLKEILGAKSSDIFCIHKCKSIEISDDVLWKLGESPDIIVRRLKPKKTI